MLLESERSNTAIFPSSHFKIPNGVSSAYVLLLSTTRKDTTLLSKTPNEQMGCRVLTAEGCSFLSSRPFDSYTQTTFPPIQKTCTLYSHALTRET